MNPEEAKNTVQNFNGNCGYIYCLSFGNGKKYIGQSIKQWKERWKRHKSKHSFCKALHSAIEKYGYKDIEFEILEYCKTKEELNNRESFYIKKFNTISPNGYNLKTKDTRTVYSFNTIVKMIKSHTHSDEIEKYLKKYIGVFFYYDLGMNIVPTLCQQNNVEFTVSERQFLSYLRDKNKWKDENFNKHFSEYRKNIIRIKNSKKVYFVEKDEIFSCAGEIVEKFPEYKLLKVGIQKCCANKRDNHKGFHFRYVE